MDTLHQHTQTNKSFCLGANEINRSRAQKGAARFFVGTSSHTTIQHFFYTTIQVLRCAAVLLYLSPSLYFKPSAWVGLQISLPPRRSFLSECCSAVHFPRQSTARPLLLPTQGCFRHLPSQYRSQSSFQCSASQSSQVAGLTSLRRLCSELYQEADPAESHSHPKY